MTTASTACFLNVNGTIHAILNWRSRQSKDDVIIGCRLSVEQAQTYDTLRQEGVSEQDICERLFPTPSAPKNSQKVSVAIDVLTKTQLVKLVRERLGKPLPSLDKLNTDDLRCILVGLAR